MTSYAGLAFHPGTRDLWTTELAKNGDRLVIAEINTNGKPSPKGPLNLPHHPVPAGIAFSADGGADRRR